MNSEFTIAVHSLVFLAYQPDSMATSEEIACSVNPHPSRVYKVMEPSAQRRLRDDQGRVGWLLSAECSPDEVTLAEIYTGLR
ncbi:hypothetical protein BK138_29675 [Paenibacillus rhizosphaerae]|uniref:MarR family transcriptional regulator n=1 Tax=Paenibacillus rhizosphaerae TaxID=297318 RepID=A0A1R1EC43_9BACL|nr:hypothetical protein BK138_29675 [Paenibacillus rhizosphaerae]